MKPIHRRLCTLAFCSSMPALGYAQSSVTLYGVMDSGVEYVNHVGAASSSVVRMPSITGEYPSRWGLRGTEDIGSGYKVEFTLESGFNVNQGTMGQGGRLFGRQAWVGFDSPYGVLSFGRQYTMGYWVLADDILGPDIYGIGSLDAYLPNARSDNTVAYKGTYKGLTVGATYSFGRDAGATANSPGQGTCAGEVPGTPTACRQWTAMVRYETASFGVAGAYDEQRGGTGAVANFFDGVAPVPLTSPADHDQRVYANGWFNVFGFKVSGGWIGRTVDFANGSSEGVHSSLFYLGASYFITPAFEIDGEGFRTVNSEHDTRATMATLRGTYFLSKRSAVYLQSSYLANSRHAAYSVSAGGGGTTPAPGTSQIGAMVGIRHLF